MIPEIKYQKTTTHTSLVEYLGSLFEINISKELHSDCFCLRIIQDPGDFAINHTAYQKRGKLADMKGAARDYFRWLTKNEK